MDFENKKHPIVGIEGFAASGKQFDLDITIPEDNRNVIYGIVRDCCKEPVCDAVVKLIEVDKHCKEDRKPISHTFTDKHGEFVFGPLCSDKCYSIEIWANLVEHIKICAKCHREGKCLKGIPMGHCDYFFGSNYKPEEDYKKDYKHCYKEDYKAEDEKDYKPCYKDDDKDEYKDDEKKEYKCCKKDETEEEYKKDYKPGCKDDDNKECKTFKKEEKEECKKNEDKKECNPCYNPCQRPYCR